MNGTQPGDLLAPLLALVAKWNSEALQHARKSRDNQWSEWVREEHSARASELNGCANELNAAISSLAAHRGEVAVIGYVRRAPFYTRDAWKECTKADHDFISANGYWTDPNGFNWPSITRPIYTAHPPQAQAVPSCPAIDADKPTDPDHKRLAALADWIDVLAPGRSLSARSYLLELSRKLAQSTPQAQAGNDEFGRRPIAWAVQSKAYGLCYSFSNEFIEAFPNAPVNYVVAQAGAGGATYTEEEINEAMEVLRGRYGSTALGDEILDGMERVLRAALEAKP